MTFDINLFNKQMAILTQVMKAIAMNDTSKDIIEKYNWLRKLDDNSPCKTFTAENIMQGANKYRRLYVKRDLVSKDAPLVQPSNK